MTTTTIWPYESVFADSEACVAFPTSRKHSTQHDSHELPGHHWEEPPAVAHINATLLVEDIHDSVSVSSPSRSSSPFMSTNNVCDTSNAAPMGLDGAWLPSEMEFESQSESDSSASLHHSTASTPHLSHSPFHAAPPANFAYQQPSMPTINETTIKPEPTRVAAPAIKEEETGDLQMTSDDIGMLAPAPLEGDIAESNYPSSSNSSVADASMHSSSSSTERLTVRARRRTRYTTAAVASEAARASLTKALPKKTSPARATSSSSTSSSLPSSPPALESAGSMDITSNGSTHSSEQDEEEEEEEDDFDGDDTITKGKQAAKRKRAAGHAALATGMLDLETPDMKGLDKRERNKVSASMYRKRRKVYLDSLEGKVGELDSTISKQNDTISKLDAENRSLKEQVSFLKKMISSFKSATGSSSATQPSNVHVGARKSAATAFIFGLVACLLIFAPSSFMEGEVESSSGFVTESAAPAIGRRGRTLLSIEEVVIDHYSSPAIGELVEFDTTNPIAAEEAEIEAKLEFLSLSNNTTGTDELHSDL